MDAETASARLESLLVAERSLQRAQRMGDVAALDALIHDDLRFIGPDNQFHGKSEDLEAHRSRSVVVVSSEQLEMDAHVFGPSAVTCVSLALRVEVGGVATAGTYRYIRGWVYEDQRWQVASGAVVAVAS